MSIDEDEELYSEEPELNPPMAWEEDAQASFDAAWKSMKWDAEKNLFTVTVDDGEREVECATYDEFANCLQEEYERGWDGSVPWDGGRAFEPDEYAVRELIAESPLRKIRMCEVGWGEFV